MQAFSMDLTKQAEVLRPITVGYEPRVLDQIRRYVEEGFSTGDGEERGGVLFGHHAGRSVNVTAMRPVPEGAGAPFILDESNEHVGLAAVLKAAPAAQNRDDLQAVGLFLSHLRDGVILRPQDRDLLERYFPETWQIALILRKDSSGTLRAATSGRANRASRFQVLDAFKLEDGVATAPAIASWIAAPAPVHEVRAVLKAPPPLVVTPRWHRWMPLIAFVLVMSPASAAFWYLRAHAPEANSLAGYRKDGVFRIEWDASSQRVARATRAILDVKDGGRQSIRELNRDDLRRGLWAVVCNQHDCTSKLSYFDGDTLIGEEQNRFVEMALQPRPLDARELAIENEELRSALERERQRVKQLSGRARR